MTEPTRKFTELSESPVQKIDITDAPGMARALLRSESMMVARNTIISVIPLPEPPYVLTTLDNAAPALNMPRSGSPQEMVGSIMDQLDARLKGAGERRMIWGTQENEAGGGALKLTRGNIDGAAFDDQVAAIERLRVAVRDNVAIPTIGPHGVDIFSAMPATGNEMQVKSAMSARMAEVIQQYQQDINKATRGGSTKAGVEYLSPLEVGSQAPHLEVATDRISTTLDAYASQLPAQAVKPASGPKPAAHKPD